MYLYIEYQLFLETKTGRQLKVIKTRDKREKNQNKQRV